MAASAEETAVDFERQRITIAISQEPPQLNTLRATDSVSFFILNHVGEGLLRYDRRQRLVAGVAERWRVDEEGATFHLRKEARWSDGRPVTAHDFVFAWRGVVDPKTASEYAFIMYPLKNAQAINRGEKPVTALGVKAKDDQTLVVEFERPCGYFASLTAFASYFPVREDFFRARGERYAADAGDLLFNGPFKLTLWDHGAALRLEKNEHYWNRERITLNRIDIPYITTDVQTHFNLFRDQKTALAGLNSETLKSAMEQRYRIRKFRDGAVFYLEFNFRPNRATRSRHLRRAIRMIYDPRELVDKVIGIPGTIPAWSLFPAWLQGEKKSFQEEYPPARDGVNIERALLELELAKKELGVERIKPLTLLADTGPTAAKQAEYLQHLFQEKLGLELRIDKQTFKQRLAKMTLGDFDLVAAGWGPDFDDPITFGDLYASWNLNNRGRFSHADYDRWVETARNAVDVKTRMAAFGRLQEILAEELPILPQYERGSVYVQHPKLKGVVRRVFGGDPDYSHARVVK